MKQLFPAQSDIVPALLSSLQNKFPLQSPRALTSQTPWAGPNYIVRAKLQELNMSLELKFIFSK